MELHQLPVCHYGAATARSLQTSVQSQVRSLTVCTSEMYTFVYYDIMLGLCSGVGLWSWHTDV